MTLKNNIKTSEVPFLQEGNELKLARLYNKQLELEKRIRNSIDSISDILDKQPLGQKDLKLYNYQDSLYNELKLPRKIHNEIGPIVAELTLDKYKGTRQDPTQENWTKGDIEKLLKDWHIRETPEVVEYFKSYIDSPGFNRILQNLDIWWEKRHPYRKYYTSSEIDDTKKYYQNRNFPVVFSVNMYADLSWYKPWQHAAYVGQKSSSLSAKKSKHLYEEALGHELSHGVSPVYTNGQKEVLDINLNTKKNNHDEYRTEKMADLWGLRYLLYKEGIYDSRSEKDITTEEIQKLRDKYPNLRPFQQMDNEQLLFLLNHVAQNNNRNNNIYYAKSGIKIKNDVLEWLIPSWFKKKENIERVMRSSNAGNISNFFGAFNKDRKDINYGSRKVGLYIIHEPENIGVGFKEPAPDKTRDLISLYLYKQSSLVPYTNPTPIVVDGEQWNDDLFEGKIFLQPNMIFPTQMQELIKDYIVNKRLLSMNSNVPSSGSWYEYDNYNATYDNVRSHYISFKEDEDGNVYADIFDRWDMDHNALGKALEKLHGNPFILRQRVPVIYSDKHDDNTMDYFLNLNYKHDDFKKALFKNFNKYNIKFDEDRISEHYNDEKTLEEYKIGGKMKKKLISKHQNGTTKGGLINKSYSGIWGNRGLGNELQSALENGLSGIWNGIKWIGDKVLNADEYIEDGLAYMAGMLPGGMNSEQMIATQKAEREAQPGEVYYDALGNTRIKPYTGVVPVLPSLPANAPSSLIKLHDNMKKLRSSWAVRESLLKKLGKLDDMPKTLTARRYKEAEKTFNDAVESMGKATHNTDPTKLTKRLKSSFKAEKARSTDDLRAANAGRPSERSLDYMESIMRNDNHPAVQKMLHNYDLKVAKGMDSKLAKQRLKEMLVDYARLRNYSWFVSKYK